MLLTITTTHRPATNLGYLLHKHPERVQTFALSFGAAHVFYPEALENRCTAALLLDVDPVGLSRRDRDTSAGPLQPYVNDRPYTASSLLSVAIAQVFGTALGGHCQDRAELVDMPMPLRASIAAVSCHGGERIVRRLFEPLGYAVTTERHPLDSEHPEWEPSPLFSIELSADCRLKDLLAHLYVLIPVLDGEKHYWVGSDEVDKLLRHGEAWLGAHPERELISQRYLKHQRSLVRQALDRLADAEDEADESALDEGDGDPSAVSVPQEEKPERADGLHEQRLGAVLAALKAEGARTVLDLGCGEGRLLRVLLQDRSFERVVGMDVSHRALEIAADRLHLDRMPAAKRARIELLHGSLLYRDERLVGFDAAAIVEVVEHMDAERLPVFTRILFEHTRPKTVVLTTPNAEYNVRFPNLPEGKLRHADHRFEWTRAEFAAWARGAAQAFAYSVRFLPVGTVDRDVGAPTQMAIFGRFEEDS